MSTGPTDARPMTVRVADDLRMRIEAGALAPGEQLPTLDELAEQYRCSLAVSRRAVDTLRSQGLVVTVQGKGTFVRSRVRARRHGIERYSRSRWAAGTAILTAEAALQGHHADQVIRELTEVSAPAAVAERLDIASDTRVWVRRRTTRIDDRPNQLADSYYPLDIVERAPLIKSENTGPGGGFARIEEAGYKLDHICEELSVRMPAPREVALLELPQGTPVVELTRTTFTKTNRPVEVMLTVIAGDMASFHYEFPIPD